MSNQTQSLNQDSDSEQKQNQNLNLNPNPNRTLLTILIFIALTLIIIGGGWLIWKQNITFLHSNNESEKPHGYESYICPDGSEVINPFQCNCKKDYDCPSDYSGGMVCGNNNKCIRKAEIEQEITITTDKTEYEQGETIKITVENNLDKSTWYNGEPSFGCANAFSMGVKENKIEEFYLLEALDCIFPFLELKPKSEQIFDLKLDKHFNEWLEIYNVKFPAIYKLEFNYGFSEKNSKEKKTYSNEFTIKEKSALDPRCGEKVIGIVLHGFSRALAMGYEYDLEIGKCVKKTMSGCSIQTPFKTLKECQEVCEKKENIALPDKNELVKCENDSNCVLVDPGKCDCNNCKTKAINEKYLDMWNKIQTNQECHLEIVCPAVGILCEPYKVKCDNNKCTAVIIHLKKH